MKEYTIEEYYGEDASIEYHRLRVIELKERYQALSKRCKENAASTDAYASAADSIAHVDSELREALNYSKLWGIE